MFHVLVQKDVLLSTQAFKPHVTGIVL